MWRICWQQFRKGRKSWTVALLDATSLSHAPPGQGCGKAWECGIFSVNLVPEPVTAFELVEQCFPSLVNRLPVAKETDPYGSARTSVYSTQYHDPDTGYIMDKQDVLAGLSPDKQS